MFLRWLYLVASSSYNHICFTVVVQTPGRKIFWYSKVPEWQSELLLEHSFPPSYYVNLMHSQYKNIAERGMTIRIVLLFIRSPFNLNTTLFRCVVVTWGPTPLPAICTWRPVRHIEWLSQWHPAPAICVSYDCSGLCSKRVIFVSVTLIFLRVERRGWYTITVLK